MRSNYRSIILALLIVAALAGGFFASGWTRHHAFASVPPSSSKPAPTVVEPKQPPTDSPPSDAAVTRIEERSPAPQVPKEVPQAIKDANGNAIMETVMTPDGPVTIHRTFTMTGEVVRERAFLNDREVPVPSQIKR